jgi:hypothetical protein
MASLKNESMGLEPTPVPIEEAFACPSTDPDFFCEQSWDPILCDEVCQYSNECEAFASGYNATTQCRSTVTPIPVEEDAIECPTMNPDFFCEQSWDPVTCDDVCQYSNTCEAAASGFNVTTQCFPVDANATVEEETPTCPPLNPDFFCEQSWDPVLCDEVCQYSNECEAIASGYNATTQCRSTVTPIPVEEDALECPTMNPDFFCEQSWYFPVFSGRLR